MKTHSVGFSLFFISILSVSSFSAAFSAEKDATMPAVKTLKGEVKMAANLKPTISNQAALYIIARPEGQTAGPPLAVKRIGAQSIHFPFPFELSSADAMIPGAKLEGKMNITARIAQKGSATPVLAGDIQTSTAVSAAPGGKSITLELNEIKK